MKLILYLHTKLILKIWRVIKMMGWIYYIVPLHAITRLENLTESKQNLAEINYLSWIKHRPLFSLGTKTEPRQSSYSIFINMYFLWQHIWGNAHLYCDWKPRSGRTSVCVLWTRFCLVFRSSKCTLGKSHLRTLLPRLGSKYYSHNILCIDRYVIHSNIHYFIAR